MYLPPANCPATSPLVTFLKSGRWRNTTIQLDTAGRRLQQVRLIQNREYALPRRLGKRSAVFEVRIVGQDCRQDLDGEAAGPGQQPPGG